MQSKLSTLLKIDWNFVMYMGMQGERIGLLLAGASARGINGSTLHRARKELGYASQRQGGRDGSYVWFPKKGWPLKEEPHHHFVNT